MLCSGSAEGGGARAGAAYGPAYTGCMSDEEGQPQAQPDRRDSPLRTRVLQLWVFAIVCGAVSLFTPHTMLFTIAGFVLLGVALVVQVRAMDRRRVRRPAAGEPTERTPDP